MKLLSLNIWGGRVHQPLLQFIAHQSATIDIFCLQEVFDAPQPRVEPTTNAHHHILSEIKDLLPDFDCYFYSAQEGPGMDANYYPGLLYGLAIFCRKTLIVEQSGDTFIHGYQNSWQPEQSLSNLSRNMAYLTLNSNGQNLTIYNIHGLWNGQGKDDSPDRLQQSQNIIDFIKSRSEPHILCGDFNLLPNTQSLGLLNQDHLNLIPKYSITSTRTSLYPKEPKFADYILLSPGITDHHFAVLPDEVSDHAALYLDFSLDPRPLIQITNNK